MDSVIEETTVEDRIVFDLRKPPNKQRKIISEHRVEYLKQLYMSIFNDEKLVNCTPILSYGTLVDNFKNIDTLIEFIKLLPYDELPNIMFDYNNKNVISKYFLNYPLNMDDLPVTDNYKEKHPKPLYDEFDFIKNKGYKSKAYKSKNTDLSYWYEFDYVYTIGADEKNKTIGVLERKSVDRIVVEDGEESVRSAYDSEGNEVPAYVETRSFYFKYTTDEKGYVDDIVYDRTEIITDDKYLDNLINYE